MEPIPNFTLANLKKVQPIQGWDGFLLEGRAFLKTATAAHAGRRKAFTPEILYNIIAMAIEKFVMAALMHRGTMPYNHTMNDLVEAMEETFPGVMEGVRERLLHFGTYQDICDLDGFRIIPPGMEEIPAMIDLAYEMQTLVDHGIMLCPEPAKVL